jgi:hypothetical protein
MKVLCLAIFFAFFFRNSNDDKEAKEFIDDNQVDLQNDEEYLHLHKVCFVIHRENQIKNDLYRRNFYLLIDLKHEPIV